MPFCCANPQNTLQNTLHTYADAHTHTHTYEYTNTTTYASEPFTNSNKIQI